MARERLFARLGEGRGRRLSLVACPAGFGKSTLLAAWREHELAHRPVAWVTLDGGDDDTVVLWSHIVEALCRACPGLAHEELAAAAAGAPLLEVALPRLVNALLEQEDVVLVLDDFHRLTSATARESVAWFVEHLPATVQLVLSTRADPALPLGALRAHGELVELRADDLRFTLDEAGEFLNARLGLGLAADDVELLVARTEGWPAGIYLAALSLTGKDDKPALVRAFDGTSAHVVDFLSTEVLDGFEPGAAGLHAAHVGARAAVRAAVRRRRRRAGVRRRARVARAHEPVPAPARRPARVVPLPPPVRAAPARRAAAARGRARAGAARPRVRVAPRATARPTRRSSMRSRPAPTPRRGS